MAVDQTLLSDAPSSFPSHLMCIGRSERWNERLACSKDAWTGRCADTD